MEIPQFGVKPKGGYRERLCAYAVIFNDDGQILALKVGETHHLPGGGIDPDEDASATVIRETMEEAGCTITDLQFLGKANHFFSETETGPINKMGAFYKARMVSMDSTKVTTSDHQVCWLTPDDFIRSSSGEFQKWAVRLISENHL